MSVKLNDIEKVDLLIRLVESLNRGNTGTPDRRVYYADEQLKQILYTINRINEGKFYG